MTFPPYPEYKDSGVEWLGLVPEHWHVERLKKIARVFPSNVDKKEHDGQEPVRLCNYVDVYYNDLIGPELPFMSATASPEQVTKFTLRADDIIITKDSETADDIAIAAYVPQDLPGVVCGYHLSMVRPKEGAAGRYIKRLFDSHPLKAQFEVSAKGLTRVGLSQYAIDNVLVTAPPVDEQHDIAAFLDRETGKIDELVAEQEKLIDLLKEKRQAAISHAVTKGLDPNVPMKDSGVEWLGEVPKHWEVLPLKRHWSVTDCKHLTAEFVDEGIPLASIREVQAVYVDLAEAKQTTPAFYAALIEGGRQPLPGDLIFSRNATVGEVAQVADWHPPFAMGQDVCLLRKKSEETSTEFLQAVLRSPVVARQLDVLMVGATFKRVNVEEIRNIIIPVPPPVEQAEIAQFASRESDRHEELAAEAQAAIDLLKERRSALISAAVTGKIDVRGLAEDAPSSPEALEPA